MRTVSATIWNAWLSGGPFIGEDAASHSRVTVEPGWALTKSGSIVGTYNKGPIRWFQSAENDQVEVEVPNIKRISIDRSIDTDAATCTITLANQWMDEVVATGAAADDLGSPGYFTFDRGSGIEATARWGQTANSWSSVLVVNALLRTYQGYGGKSKSVEMAIADENIVLTGLWLVDEIRVNARGDLEMVCRDMARLLIDQKLYPPLVPPGPNGYPLKRCRWIPHAEIIEHQPQLGTSMDQGFSYGNCVGPSVASASDAYYGFNGRVHGHRPTDALDGNGGSFWLSVGNATQHAPFAWEWIEVCCGGGNIDAVFIDPMIPDGGTYTCYISVWENGGWVDGSGGAVIDYQTGGIGIYTGANTARIPWVWKGGVSGPIEVRLPRAFAAGKYRLTFTTLRNFSTITGGFAWRAGLRETRPRLAGLAPTPGWRETRTWQTDGNYLDYSDIIKDLLLWSGFWLYEPTVTGMPSVFGNIESTGAWAERGCLDEEFFEKKAVIEAINGIKEIVGYLFYVDEDGAAHFESENIWASGNFNELGQHTTFIPEIDEALQLTDYTVVASAEALRTEIVISTDDPEKETYATTVTTRYRPETGELLRGIERPAMWLNEIFTDRAEQRIMAELVAMRIFFSQRQGNVSCAANPAIQINDQVRVFERTTGETNIHYVRSVQSEHDLESGAYTMTLTTHWLGSETDWLITRDDIPGEESSASRPRWVLSEALSAWLKRHEARTIAVSRFLV